MKAIRLENLRSLKDTGSVEIKPLTLLLGNNSSGKSTFLRVFPLLRQSAEVRTIGPLLWYGRLVDFGTFQEALYNKAAKQEIAFHFNIKVPAPSTPEGKLFWRATHRNVNILETLDLELELRVTADSKSGTTRSKECCIRFAGHVITIEFDNDNKVSKFLVNKSDLLALSSVKFRHSQAGYLVPKVYEDLGIASNLPVTLFYNFRANTGILTLLTNEIRTHAHHKTSNDTIHQIARSIGIGPTEVMLKNIMNNKYGGETWKRKLSGWTVSDPSFIKLSDMAIAYTASDLLDTVDSYLEHLSNNIFYIKPLRAYAERYHRMQDLAVDEVDSQGQNLAMFFRNMSDGERKSFAEWCEEHFAIVPVLKSSGGQFYIGIREKNTSIEHNMTDMGFGFSQVLPIITQLWVLSIQKGKTFKRKGIPIFFTIEQPELHLHPRLQSKLTDALIAAIKTAKDMGVDLRLIIETHSETVINTIGHRISSGVCRSADVNILIFDKGEENTTVRTASFNSDGYLQDWPYGFFDPELI
jgi:hypothetical protein